MGIPYRFDPLGTLGGNPLAGYVTDGLILAFDVLLETPGTRDYLTNWASGTRCVFSTPLLITAGYISGATAEKAKFNPSPLQNIDGHPPVGMDYSADICCEKRGYMDFLVWKEWQFISGSYGIGAQVHQTSDGIRVQGAAGADVYDKIISYSLINGQKVSAHIDFDTVSSLKIDGESAGEFKKVIASVGGNSFAFGTSSSASPATEARLFAYRLYNRRLTIAEQRQNYALDKKRFGL